VTLTACERFTVSAENQWSHISSLCEPRAFASCITFNQQYVYVFGGMHDYQILKSIEKYDSLADTWTVMYFQMPKPLAKLGSVLIGEQAIMIVGGMSGTFEPSNEVWMLDLRDFEWSEKAPMYHPRLTSSGLFFSSEGEDPYVYAIGGNRSKTIERYSVKANSWEILPSFKEATESDITGTNNFLFTYTMCATNF
jgi:N-acetylneuraminic acid mutarotase